MDINDRPIRTVLGKQKKIAGTLLQPDLRGKHDNHATVSQEIRDGIKQHIDSIPKIESHYTRANTSRTFIEGSKSIADIHKDYVPKCKEEQKQFGNYTLFYRIFTEEYNISFYTPKKDQCDVCTAFENATETEKDDMKESYDLHHREKELSRTEKARDKEKKDCAVAVYVLQAVMQLPKEEVSVFYYKSKSNILNFTIYNLKSNACNCYIWNESNGHRGVNELGTCVLKYLKDTCDSGYTDIISYSDNCYGQQKNKFMLALYLYAVTNLDIHSITHKYLIKGHTQNEGDSAHSLIERQVKRLLKSGPMYVPETFVTAVRAAKKKGDPFVVQELCYEDFKNIKLLVNEIGPMNLKEFKLSDAKVLRVTKSSPRSVFYKNSYADEFQETTVFKAKNYPRTVSLLPAFSVKPGLPKNKKDDLIGLCKKNLIPNQYKLFYESL